MLLSLHRFLYPNVFRQMLILAFDKNIAFLRQTVSDTEHETRRHFFLTAAATTTQTLAKRSTVTDSNFGFDSGSATSIFNAVGR